MLPVTTLRTLTWGQPNKPSDPITLSAASSLVTVGEYFYVVIDDALSLGMFHQENTSPGIAVKLFEGELPTDNLERKAQKPDLEALALLPAFDGYPHGALMAFASGSKPNRQIGVVLALDDTGKVRGNPHYVDLSVLYDQIRDEIKSINIEGAVVVDRDVFLLQRGNKKAKLNALIKISLNGLIELVTENRFRKKRQIDIFPCVLGEIGDIPLCFTDASIITPHRLMVTVVAENTDDTISDGACAASALAIIELDGTVVWYSPLENKPKVEGLAVKVQENDFIVYLVSDADNPSIPANLMMTKVPMNSIAKEQSQ